RAKPDDAVFGPWHDLFALADADISAGARKVIERWKARPTAQVNPLVLQALAAATLANKADVARAYGDLVRHIYDESKKSPVVDEPRRQLLEIVTGRDSPLYFPRSQTRHYMSRQDKDAFGGKVEELDKIAVKAANPPPRAMALVDAPELHNPRILVRGNPSHLGDPVPRRFLWIVEGDGRKPFPHGSGRLDLAKAITAPDNPLTARVIVNRVWTHHFGEPL